MATIVRVYDGATRVIVSGSELLAPLVAQAQGSASAAAASAATASINANLIQANTPAGYADVFSDADGRFVGGVTDQGVLSFNSMQALASMVIGSAGATIVPDAGGTVAGVRDQAGNMPWFVDESGVTNASALKATTLNGLPTTQFALLGDARATKPLIPAQIIAAPSDGQSLAIGVSTGTPGVGAVITTSTRFGSAGALMLHGGVRSWDPTEDDASLVPAVEVVGAGGDVANSAGETPQSGFAEFLNELLWKENGLRPADHGMQAAIFAPGLGSTTIAQHQSGTSLYNRHHAEAQAIKSLATAAGKTCKKLATSWRQGESDGTNTNYRNDLITLRNSDAAATKTEFGQTEELYYICYQNMVPPNALQFYLATKLSQYIKIANPTYWMAHTGGVHFTAFTSKLDGAYHALMFKRLFIDGRKWNAIRPLLDVDGNLAAVRAGNQVTMTFDAPSGGQLTFDTASAFKGAARQFGHYLFASDGTTELAVSDVSIIGRNQVRITAAAAIPSGAIWRYGYTDPTANAHVANGNMRDNQGDWLRFDGANNSMNAPMHNWCVAFEESIA